MGTHCRGQLADGGEPKKQMPSPSLSAHRRLADGFSGKGLEWMALMA